MQDIYQKTISSPINFVGIGLHSGKISKVRLIPNFENQGIVFKRTDLDKDNIVEASFKNVSSAKLCTTLENSNGVKVSTVEHLLAALYIVGIDNVIIELLIKGLLLIIQTNEFLSDISNLLKKYLCVSKTSDLDVASFLGLT